MSDISLFPRPQSIKRSEGSFTLDADTVICAQDRNLGETLASYLRPATGFTLPVESAGDTTDSRNVISLVEETDLDSSEAYSLLVSSDKVELSASAPAGFRHGFQTLRQLLPPQILGRRTRRRHRLENTCPKNQRCAGFWLAWLTPGCRTSYVSA